MHFAPLTKDTYSIPTRDLPVHYDVPERYTKSTQRCIPFSVRGMTRSEVGWRPFHCRIWVRDDVEAMKAKHSLHDCKDVSVERV